MVTQITGAVINIILDPTLLFGYFGFPALGTAGAAIATVTGQIIAMTLGFIFNLKCNKEIHQIKRHLFRTDRIGRTCIITSFSGTDHAGF